MWVAFQFGQSGASLFYPAGNGSHHWLLHSSLFHRKVNSSSYVPATPLVAEEINSSEAMAAQRALLQFEIFREMKNSWNMILAAAPKFGEELGNRAAEIRELIVSFDQKMAEQEDAESTPDELEEEAQSIEKAVADLEADLDVLAMRDPKIEPEWAHRNEKVLAAMEKFEALSEITFPDDKTTTAERTCSVISGDKVLGKFIRVARRSEYEILFLKDGIEFAKESSETGKDSRFFGLARKAWDAKKFYSQYETLDKDTRNYQVLEKDWFFDNEIAKLQVSGPGCDLIFPLSQYKSIPHGYLDDSILGMLQLNGLLKLEDK